MASGQLSEASWGLPQAQLLLALLASSGDLIAQREWEIKQTCSLLEQVDVHRLMAADLLLEHLCQCLGKAFTSLVPQLVAGPLDSGKQRAAASMCSLSRALDQWITRYTAQQELSAADTGRIASTGGCRSDESVRFSMQQLVWIVNSNCCEHTVQTASS